MPSVAARQYELVYIVSPEASEQDIAGIHTEIESIVARFSGHIEKTESWGKRRFAYPISRHKEGTYVLELINGSGDLVKELDRRLRVSDQVIRHLVVRVDEETRVAERRAAERKATRDRRRAGRPDRPERAEGAGRGPERLESMTDQDTQDTEE